MAARLSVHPDSTNPWLWGIMVGMSILLIQALLIADCWSSCRTRQWRDQTRNSCYCLMANCSSPAVVHVSLLHCSNLWYHATRSCRLHGIQHPFLHARQLVRDNFFSPVHKALQSAQGGLVGFDFHWCGRSKNNPPLHVRCLGNSCVALLLINNGTFTPEDELGEAAVVAANWENQYSIC